MTSIEQVEQHEAGAHLRVAASEGGRPENGSRRARWRVNAQHAQVQVRPKSAASTRTDAGRNHQQHHDIGPEIRVWAYCRSNSRSKAGRVPLVDVNLSAPRGPAASGPTTARSGATGGSAGSWTTSGLSAVYSSRNTNSARDARAFCIAYLWSKSLRAALNS